jgi:hypothetical protein
VKTIVTKRLGLNKNNLDETEIIGD